MRTRISHEDDLKSTEARYHYHLFLVRQWKKPWIHVARCAVMMQKPVLCLTLSGVFSLQLPWKPLVLLSWTADSKAGTEEKTPSEEEPHCSRKKTTNSWSLNSSASTLLDGRRTTLPLRWLLLCSWVITINPAFISCSELRIKVPFLLGLFLEALAQSKLILFLVIFQQMLHWCTPQ